jgi:hypothetical protein
MLGVGGVRFFRHFRIAAGTSSRVEIILKEAAMRVADSTSKATNLAVCIALLIALGQCRAYAGVVFTANATVAGVVDLDQSNVPGGTAIAMVNHLGASAVGRAEHGLIGASASSNAAGAGVGASGAATFSSGFVVLGNPGGSTLPLQFNVYLNGSLSIDPIAPLFSGGASSFSNVNVNGTTWSGGISLDSDFVSTDVLLFGDMEQGFVEEDLASNTKTAAVNARFGLLVPMANTGTISASINAGVVGGNAIAASDFTGGWVLESITLPHDFADPNVNVNDLNVQFDSGVTMPVSIDVAPVPEASSLAVWTIMGAACAFWSYAAKRRTRPLFF